MKLSFLVQQIAAILNQVLYHGWEGELYGHLDFVGPLNGHLSCRDLPQFRPRRMPCYRPPDWILTGDEEVFGYFLLFTWTQHDGYMLLRERSARPGVEDDAVSLALGGITTICMVFEQYRLRPFRVTFMDDAGKVHDICHVERGPNLANTKGKFEWLEGECGWRVEDGVRVPYGFFIDQFYWHDQAHSDQQK
ncbi:MAG: hypothetical protein U0872_01840 [Planctomycetaceae bacterium]